MVSGLHRCTRMEDSTASGVWECVCVYVCMDVSVCACFCVYTGVYTCVRAPVHAHTRACACAPACMFYVPEHEEVEVRRGWCPWVEAAWRGCQDDS